MIDHIGNYQRSAQQGLPIYRLVGGAGYVWAASWNEAGVGTLRFLAIDPSAIAPETPVASKVEPSTATTPTGPLSSEQVRTKDAGQAKIGDAVEAARTRDAEPPRLRDAETAKPAMQQGASSNGGPAERIVGEFARMVAIPAECQTARELGKSGRWKERG
jgi:hypothetical protein